MIAAQVTNHVQDPSRDHPSYSFREGSLITRPVDVSLNPGDDRPSRNILEPWNFGTD